MSILSLPNELLDYVAEVTESEGDLNALTRVNQRFYNIFDPYLYHRNVRCSGSSALCWAAWHGNVKTAQKLLDIGANPQGLGGCRSAIHIAAAQGHQAIVELLLAQEGIELDNDCQPSLLWWPVCRQDEGIVKLLIADGRLDFKHYCPDRMTPLIKAVMDGSKRIVEILLTSENIDVDFHYEYTERNALNSAIRRSNEPIVRMLLANGASIEPPDDRFMAPLGFAARHGNETIFRLLLEKGANPEVMHYRLGTLVSIAAMKGHENIVRLLLEMGIDPNIPDPTGRSPLHLVAMTGKVNTCKILLEKGVNLKSRDTHDMTPLFGAARYGNGAIIQLLIEKGVDPNADTDTNRRTALYYAVERGHALVVKLLVEEGRVDLSSECDSFARTPLSYAAEYGHEKVVKLLLELDYSSGAVPDKDGRTPLYYAATEGNEVPTELLLERIKVDPFITPAVERLLSCPDKIKNGNEKILDLLRASLKNARMYSTQDFHHYIGD